METTRRTFLKTTAAAGTIAALPPAAHAALLQPGAPAPMPDPAPTKGIGLYPGTASENFDPTLILDPAAPYRNLALLRPAFASSSYDYNLTAQLVTDGLTDTTLPTWITTVINGQIQPKNERESLIDHFPENVVELPGINPTIEFHLGGGGITAPSVDRVQLFVVLPDYTVPSTLVFTISVSEDGHLWRSVGTTTGGPKLDPVNYPPDLVRGNMLLAPSISFTAPAASRFYRVEFTTASDNQTVTGPDTPASVAHVAWRCGQVAFYSGQQRIEFGGPYHFTSAWKGSSLDEEWLYVDLGAPFPIDRVKLHWIARAREGKLQVSADATTWQDLAPLPATGTVDDISVTTTTRYLRVLMLSPATAEGYILSELEVLGHGGFLAKPAPAATDGTLSGGQWLLQRAPQVAATGEQISTPTFSPSNWLTATVPGTVLTTYFNLGAIPDPNYGQNQLGISDSFFYADFWYRTTFPTPARDADGLTWLTFDGINWKAEVFLNGTHLGPIAGGFTRARFDISTLTRPGQTNTLAVLICKNDTPGSCKQKTYQSTGKNGGGLGADNPTYHASIGWDWIPTIRGRNTGIWADVTLTTTGPVTLADPLVTSIITPDHTSASVAIELVAQNHTARPITGTVRGKYGSIPVNQSITLAPNETRTLKLTPLTLQNPELWWPTGYGAPHLYDVELRFESRGRTTHRLAFQSGIRQMTANEDGGKLRLFINGRRFIARGGNWGFGESMLRYRAREYDAAVRYHRDQNFTMIRNWVGQIGDDAFYEACDRHGLVVWQDFWLANPWDGPEPDSNTLFLANARDYLLRIRRHASLGLYCGRNEWFPPAALQSGLKALLAELHPDLHYIGSSADGPVSGHGPYRTLSAPNYFRTADQKFHSEIGAPTIPPIESVREMMPKAALWPQGLDWGLHDFTLQGAQGGTSLLSLIENSYGGAHSAEEWVTLAQFLNYDTYRAIFEAHSKYRMGILLWMSHPCWPSFVWQTYDYYFEPTSAYFGCKKGSEPLHIQWNSLLETIEVVNYNAGHAPDLTAQIEILTMDGKQAFTQSLQLTSEEDTTQTILTLAYPQRLTPVHFIRLTLSQSGTQAGKPISTNFYLRGLEAGDYRAIRTLPRATVTHTTTQERRGAQWHLTTTLRNTGQTPALMLRLKAIRATTGDRILPALYEDNYIALMPGESRTLRTELNQADTRNQPPAITLEGFNLQSS